MDARNSALYLLNKRALIERIHFETAKGMDMDMTRDRIVNRESFLNMLDLEVKRARRYQNFFSILRLKLSPLPSFENRTDSKIFCKTLSELLAKDLRESDILCSLVDDQWAILIPYADLSDIGQLKLRLMGSLEYYDFKEKGFEVLTDLVCFPTDGTNTTDLIRKL
jgi:GGDEF domain-containing protein